MMGAVNTKKTNNDNDNNKNANNNNNNNKNDEMNIGAPQRVVGADWTHKSNLDVNVFAAPKTEPHGQIKAGTVTNFAFRDLEAWHFRPHHLNKSKDWVLAPPSGAAWEAIIDKDTIKVLSFNVWFSPHEMPKRMKAIGGLVEKHDPDLVAFQEVTVVILKELLSQPWAKSYFVSDAFGQELNGYGCCILSKKNFNELMLRNFESSQGRKALFGSVMVNGRDQLVFGTFHFESYPRDRPVRAKQMAYYKKLMKDAKICILVGDSNISYEMEDHLMEPEFNDAWASLYQRTPDEAVRNPGSTFDSYKNKMSHDINVINLAARLDRLYYTPNTLKPISMEIIGTEPFEENLWPSDHWGIVTTLQFI